MPNTPPPFPLLVESETGGGGVQIPYTNMKVEQVGSRQCQHEQNLSLQKKQDILAAPQGSVLPTNSKCTGSLSRFKSAKLVISTPLCLINVHPGKRV